MMPSGISCQCQSSRGAMGLRPLSAIQASRSKYSSGGLLSFACVGGNSSKGAKDGGGGPWELPVALAAMSTAATTAQETAARMNLEFPLLVLPATNSSGVYPAAEAARRAKRGMRNLCPSKDLCDNSEPVC